MTKELAWRYHKYFELDRHHQLGRVYLAVMLDDEPIDEVILKNLDHERQLCTLGTSMRSDAYKNTGYGTQAAIHTLQHAFDELGMKTVFADALLANTRSQHVLRKIGFRETHRDDAFFYYQRDKCTWTAPNLQAHA